jgi:predicted hotdog family 3-hydroxylacyl-ACP dehydratase
MAGNHISDITIEDLIPHRGRMKLVNRIIEIDENMAITSAIVTEQWPLLSGMAVKPLVLVELVAQTAGLSNGLERVSLYGIDADKSGWLAGIKQCELLTGNIPCGTEIITVAKNIFAFENYRQVSGTAYINSRLAGKCILQVIGAEDT